MPGPDADPGVSRLSERERETLRFLLRGHDAKSIGLALGISVHVVNERLREARRKLGVTSSRGAARILADHEGTARISWDKKIGVAGGPPRDPDRGDTNRGSPMPQTDVAPKVIATRPAEGQAIAPGPFVLSVTFDQPMREGNYSFVRISAGTYPECAAHPSLSADRRTYRLQCTAVGGRAYEIWFNRPPYMNFKGDSGIAAEPHRLTFRATEG